MKYNNVIILCLVLLLILYAFITNPKSKYSIKEKQLFGHVTEIGNNYIIIKGKERIYVSLNDNKTNYNDYIFVKGKMIYPSSSFKNYLKSKKINYIMKSNSITVIKKNTNIFYSIKNRLYKKINNYKSKSYLYTFILGDKKDINKDIKNVYSNLGVIHLLSISGSYISIIISFLNYILKRLKNKRRIIIIFLILYNFLTSLQISILRSSLSYFFITLKNKYNLDIKNDTILLFILLLFLIINPYYIFNIGLILSFLLSYSLNKFNYIFKEKKVIYKSFLISLISFFTSLPIIIYLNNTINILSIVLNIIYVPFVCFIIFPFSFLTILFPFFDYYYFYLISFLENISIHLDEIKIFMFHFSNIPILYYFIYYLLLFYKSNKFIYLIIIFYFYNLYIFIPRIIFIDVGQGDSILFRFNNKNILIDTGGSFNQSYKDNYSKTLYNFGVKKIDVLIISHGDFDHMGEAINLVEKFKVEKVIFNCGQYNDLENELIKLLDKKKINYYSCIEKLNIAKYKLEFLQTKEYDNENDNSNVIYTEINGYKFMFMGDASSTTEKEILDIYDLPNIDVLKVGHHGSKTSSSKEFINEINPKYSIISVGKNNRYGHPNKEVLNNLKDSKIYRTDRDGSIMFKVKNSKLEIETCSP